MMTAALADRLRAADLTYPEAGATTGVLPPGYHHLRRQRWIYCRRACGSAGPA